jgi:hemerythrin
MQFLEMAMVSRHYNPSGVVRRRWVRAPGDLWRWKNGENLDLDQNSLPCAIIEFGRLPGPKATKNPEKPLRKAKEENVMALITWTQDAFGTNVGVADDQHQVLFSMLNGLHDAVAGGNRNTVGVKLDELIGYVVMHFKTEEDLMRKHGYPDFTAHKAEHDKLVATCADVQKKFHSGELDITADTTEFVKDWLVSHIPNVDKHYGPFFSSKGVA